MAGRGTRLGLSISKELALLGSAAEGSPVLSEIMLQRMADAGIREIVLVVAAHKQDICDHFGSVYVCEAGSNTMAEDLQLGLQYVSADNSPSTPASLDAAYELVKDRVCALGFADILYSNCPGYRRALAALNNGKADVVLGLFPSNQAADVDMVSFDANDRVTDIVIKRPEGARLFYTWSLAVWRPSFTEFLHSQQALRKQAEYQDPLARELYVGDVFLAAMDQGLKVDAVVVSSQPSLDAGTPASLALARSMDW